MFPSGSKGNEICLRREKFTKVNEITSWWNTTASCDGDVFILDLHEKQHGPHGLIAGMTGSGKSEFIITYILSLAINYSPNDVAFILIDYQDLLSSHEGN